MATRFKKSKRLSELSDAELKYAELSISDPYMQSGLVMDKPDDFDAIRDTLEIINAYSCNSEQTEKIRCLDCGWARHLKGCTLQAPDGRKFLLGSVCGPRLLGRTWKELWGKYGLHVKRQRHLHWLDDIKPALLKAIPLLYDWDAPAAALRNTRNCFQVAMPSMFELLSQSARNDGLLHG